MKMYVDELPKSCNECPCCNWDGDWGYDCNLADLDIQTNYDASTGVYYCNRQRHKDCPLQSLADYTKQVRKEVCEEIAQKMANKLVRMQPDGEFGTRLAIDWYDVNKVLDQIQGETNGDR